MYEHITYETVLQRMLDRIPNNMDKREGSVIWDALAPAAVEIKLMYIELDDIIRESFADTASREYLIRRAAERGIVPEPATKAVLQGEFTPDTIYVTGKRFSMPGSLKTYVVKEQIEPGIYQVQCESAGAEGNHYLGTIIPIDFIQGLLTAELTDLLIPAVNDEGTEQLRQRYFNTFDGKAFGGNVKYYLDKTNSIEGVGAAKVTPIWNGGGTVKLTILDALFNPASPLLIDTVQTEIDPTQNNGEGLGLAPIGHVVTVVTAEPVTVDIQTTVTLDGVTWASVKQDVIDSLEAYFLGLRMSWANEDHLTVRVAQVDTSILSVPGVIDVGGTTLNGTAGNITLGPYEVPLLGSVSA